jgi:hypothetical protein
MTIVMAKSIKMIRSVASVAQAQNAPVTPDHQRPKAKAFARPAHKLVKAPDHGVNVKAMSILQPERSAVMGKMIIAMKRRTTKMPLVPQLAI